MKRIFKILLIIIVVLFFLFGINVEKAYATRQPYDNEEEIIISRNMENGNITYTGINSDISTYSASNRMVTEEYNPNDLQTMNIIGGDERTKVDNTNMFPYSTVAYLESTFPNGQTYRGTAFIIYKNLALTAAHCIYRKDCGGYANIVQIWPGRNGNYTPYGSAIATNLHMTKGYQDSQLQNHDWAMLQLDSDIGNKCGWRGIAYSDSYNALLNKNATISGYPGDREGYLNQYVASGPIKRVDDFFSYLYYDVDTGGGQSGAPVWESGYAVGIHAHAENSGNPALNYCCNINKTRFQYFVSYMN